ncbi:Acetoin:2,6-dichlorophenolindophenol oxidoreductase subunit beta [Achromobacter spanius]|uniref:alpha-ketoacid dehydrogenase subunit alpha/beta n=1 Tax=Achromobacter spanius TaxID=217203 RepID=UPI000C2CDF1E|nr:dehydrogenase E1 component subunit alpha/beta [Achromobacter spanius]AUA56210.1 MFS transporter [Achromobacter spanius]CAB3709881.1 1-deoxy-D-xylulose-5-phosphate synthase [Achromobacter spanius]SPT39160.1 Acetoin:2,6-dichlorophenolindophenol oxidoreductase subunit beta [Achromobacter denitrificans]VEE56236.1 Acetoin:2,6-dichlorophenolindophenol oxidoreductase subunit beta [Achromobacter spanius]
MATYQPLESQAPWRQLTVDTGDWQQADPALLGTMLTQLHWIRAFEEAVLDLAAEGLVHGPAHSSVGQEGGAVGSVLALSAGDQINGSHRGHHQFLAKALQHVAPLGLDPRNPLTPAIDEVLQKTLAEIMGLAQGYCRGRGGSMHLRWLEAGALGTNAIVGGGVPLAAGAGWAHKHAGTDRVAVTYFGDGAVNIGSVLETMNLTAAWKTPLCFFIENNRYAVSTTVEESTAEPRLSARGLAFNIPSWKVDGMDPLAVHLAMSEAVAHMRAGNGPTIVEVDVYRFFHQNGPFPGSAFGYRTKDEEAQWRRRDPLDKIATEMIGRQLITQAEVDALRQRCKDVMKDVCSRLTEAADGGKRRVRADLWPRPDFRDVGLRSDGAELAGLRYQDADDYTGAKVERKFVDAVADVLDRRMETDPGVIVLGEDVHRLKGGTNGATRGLKDKYPDRVLGTPISENAFAGLGGGLAMDGRYKPIVEFMYPDFMWVAADQIFNQIGKARHMFGGDIDVPFVLRTKVAMGTGYGSQHSMDPAGIFATAPGWRIVAPSTPYDYVGLMNTALASKDPVLVIEHVDLYASSGDVADGDLDYAIPFGRARVRREGGKVTILTYLSMVSRALKAAEEAGVDAEVIDLRTLDRASLDWDTIGASIQKTNNVLIVEQGARGTSYGAMLSDEIQRRYFDWLDQPIKRVTGGEASPSISKVLERAAFADTEEVLAGLADVLADLGEQA